MTTRFVLTLLMLAALTGCRATGTAPRPPDEHTLDVTSGRTSSSSSWIPAAHHGKTVRFAVHLTRLADFSALNAGRPSIELTPESGGSPTTLAGSDPLRPGAFRVEGQLPPAGRYRWALVVNAPDDGSP